MADTIITTGKYMDHIYFSEDGLLRDEGPIPEYAYTMMICVDSYRDGMAFGRIRTYLFEEEFHFCTLDQIVFVLDEILDRAGIVCRETRMRTELRPQKKKGVWLQEDEEFEQFIRDEAQERQETFYGRDGMAVKAGDVANFHVRIVSRLHSSMQSVISRQRGANIETMPFRSALELLYLISNTLEKL